MFCGRSVHPGAEVHGDDRGRMHRNTLTLGENWLSSEKDLRDSFCSRAVGQRKSPKTILFYTMYQQNNGWNLKVSLSQSTARAVTIVAKQSIYKCILLIKLECLTSARGL